MPEMLMVKYMDCTDLPRAYAWGPVDMEEHIRELAAEHFEKYTREKRALGDFTNGDPSTYTVKVEKFFSPDKTEKEEG